MTAVPGCAGACPLSALDYSDVENGRVSAECGRLWLLTPGAGWHVARPGIACAPRPRVVVGRRGSIAR